MVLEIKRLIAGKANSMAFSKSREETIIDAPCVVFVGSVIFFESLINPLRSNSDQCQITLWNINAFSAKEVMRIKDMITEHEFR